MSNSVEFRLEKIYKAVQPMKTRTLPKLKRNTKDSMPYVSIVTPTIRDNCMDRIFQNYLSQSYKNKELIIILNNNSMSLKAWKDRASNYKDIKVFQLDESATLGDCRNFGVDHSKYDYIAHFDDDDYYGPDYLQNAMKIFLQKDVDIIGKATTFVYFEKSKCLALSSPRNEYRYVTHVPDATLIIQRHVFKKVRFSSMTLAVEKDFQKRCLNHGFKIYSGDRYDYVIIRCADKKNHTWRESDQSILSYSHVIAFTDQYHKLINSKPSPHRTSK